MTLRKFSLPALPSIAKGKTDHFVIGEMSDLFQLAGTLGLERDYGDAWSGGMDFEEARQCLMTGHLPSVAPSDEFLRKVEDLCPAPTASHAWMDDVAGAIPNVPAFLSGHPMNMRRRVKRENEASPIAIIVDLTSSAAISPEQLRKRGAAILALARALSSRRPVEIWAGTGLDAQTRKNALWQFYRIESAPLDLARAAFALGHPSFARKLQYAVARKLYEFNGGWPYGQQGNLKGMEKEIWSRAFPHITDVIAISSAFGDDKVLKDPIKWIADHVAAYTEMDQAA